MSVCVEQKFSFSILNFRTFAFAALLMLGFVLFTSSRFALFTLSFSLSLFGLRLHFLSLSHQKCILPDFRAGLTAAAAFFFHISCPLRLLVKLFAASYFRISLSLCRHTHSNGVHPTTKISLYAYRLRLFTYKTSPSN